MKLNIRKLPAGLKASIGFFVANVITSGIAYLTTPIYTRLLTPDQYGTTSVFFTWMTLFGIVAMFSLSYGVFNNGMMDFENDRNVFSFSMLALSNVITLVFAITLLVMYPFVNKYIGIGIPLLLLMFVMFLFQPAYNFWAARQRYEYKYKLSLLYSTLMAIISPLVSIFAIYFSNNKLYARIFGAEISLLIFYIGFYIYLFYRAHGKINFKYWKFAFKFNLPLIPHYLSMHLLSSADRIMIANIVNASSAAYYSVANSAASVVTIVWNAANSSLIPYTYEKCKTNNYNSISKVAVPLLTLFFLACLLMILVAPELIQIMATSDYSQAISVIPPIIGGVFFQVQYNLYSNIIYYFGAPKYVMYSSVTATISNIALNFIFIKRFGFKAAGYTTLVSYLIQAIIDYWAMKKVSGHKVYNMKIVGLLSLIMLLIAIISPLIYDYPYVRYSLLAFGLLVAFTFRKKIISVFLFTKEKD